MAAPLGSSVPAHNLPIQVNFSNYKSLASVQKSVGGREKFHMTVLFAQMADEMIQAKSGSILQDIQGERACQSLAQTARLKFQGYVMLGPSQDILAAKYLPVDKKTGADLTAAYESDLVGQARRMVRRAADQMEKSKTGSSKASRAPHVATRVSPDSEIAEVQGEKVYIMDTRTPLLHITVKRGANEGDMKQANSMPAPSDLELRLKDLSADPTRPAQI
ncbi:MAG: hypothetical protein ACI9S8_003031 [Chlamydiales bacterium]|jgi:hypothetical protein